MEDSPQYVGSYCGDAGVCFVYTDSAGQRCCFYQPPMRDTDQSLLSVAVDKFCTLVDASKQHVALAVAMSADDVFVRSIITPSGLSDTQLEQLAIVEAVVNLPVPPEEICLDFIRLDDAAKTTEEKTRLAFCRRERIDEILAGVEGAPLSVAVVDRDVQALHDAVFSVAAVSGQAPIRYPFGLLLTEINPRLIISLDALTFEIYPVRIAISDPADLQTELRQQLSHCWTRCRMAQGVDALTLETLICIGEGLPDDAAWLAGLSLENGQGISRLALSMLRDSMFMLSDSATPSDEVLLIALGMANRVLR
jgi:hypothetical protein